MNSIPASSPAIRVSFTAANEHSANRIANVLAESFDNNDTAIAAFERSDGHWDVALYFTDRPNEDAVRTLVRLASDETTAQSIVFDTVEARDWVQASLKDLAPVNAGRFVVHGHHDRARVSVNKIGIEIEAALAFGTGHHGTTRGCLLLLDQVLRARWPRRVLDLGTGTGVLAIAATKALRHPILASDIDLRSVITARNNAHQNGVGHLVEVVHAKGFCSPKFRTQAPFDLVMANILANPLRQLAIPIAQRLKPSAFIILSGLLPHQANGVIAAYRSSGLIFVKQLQLEGWTSLLMQKP